jgi:ABC-type transporter Mla MlaB component
MTHDDKKKSGSRKTASKLGHDPLAWINESEDDTGFSSKATSGQSAVVNNDAPIPEQKGPASVVDTTTTDATGAVGNTVKKDNQVLRLPVFFGIAQASDICSQMRNILSSGCSVVEIAANDVESIDAAGLQLMVAFSKQASDSGIVVKWTGSSQKIKAVASLLNVKI